MSRCLFRKLHTAQPVIKWGVSTFGSAVTWCPTVTCPSGSSGLCWEELVNSGVKTSAALTIWQTGKEAKTCRYWLEIPLGMKNISVPFASHFLNGLPQPTFELSNVIYMKEIIDWILCLVMAAFFCSPTKSFLDKTLCDWIKAAVDSQWKNNSAIKLHTGEAWIQTLKDLEIGSVQMRLYAHCLGVAERAEHKSLSQ